MRLPPLDVSPEDRVVLERRARSKTASQRDVTHACIILLAADGEPNTAIRNAVGIHYNNVAVARNNEAEGLDGLNDYPRPGRPVTYGHDDRLRIEKKICDTPPEPASPWTMDAVSQALFDEVEVSARLQAA
jgi:hypothetical protein